MCVVFLSERIMLVQELLLYAAFRFLYLSLDHLLTCETYQVLGESAGSMLGRELEGLIQRAREYKKEFGDSFVSVEHLVLGFAEDNRFGKQLFKDFQLSLKSLKDAIQSIRGRQTVIDQGMISGVSLLSCRYSRIMQFH